MRAEIIAIGTELTTGAKLDTNSQWLSLELSRLGIPVQYHTTVADGLDEMVAVFRLASDRADLVVITGGLGPTLDDLTRQALAAMTGQELTLDQPSLEVIREMFAHRGREMPERNSIQAMFPTGSEPIPNPRGTAPGIWWELPVGVGSSVTLLVALPGVPSEMKSMFHERVAPRLPCSGRVIRSARVNCFGGGESAIEELLGDLTERGRNPEVGITAHEATITLRIAAHGAAVAECESLIEQTRQRIYQTLGQLVFGEEDQELQDVVVALLVDQGKTLATVEQGTGGLLAQRLAGVSGIEQVYQHGTVITGMSGRPQARDRDGSSATRLAPAQRTLRLAQECRESRGVDYALAIGGLVEGPPGAPAAPMMHVGLSGRSCDAVHAVTKLGDPAIMKGRTAKAALNHLRLHLLPD
ncbi:MAG: CinA family nicotinamide mononucleotide deamidase-related protein [Planctomycetaceae bacterium]